MKTILIIDDDLGFVFWLGRLLTDAGYNALPAKEVEAARSLLGELHCGIDLLIVNPSLPGLTDFADALRQSSTNVKVIALLGGEKQSPNQLRNADMVAQKPLQTDTAADTLWIKTVERALRILTPRSDGTPN